MLRRLIGEYLALLDSAADPGDPVIGRLFPPASLEDAGVAASYRDLAQDDLTRHKRHTAEVALGSLVEGGGRQRSLDDDEMQAWLVVLTDLRLAIGTKQGVTEEVMDRPIDPNDPEQFPLAILHYLGALQESLVRSLM